VVPVVSVQSSHRIGFVVESRVAVVEEGARSAMRR
jgi:hypothetical protein